MADVRGASLQPIYNQLNSAPAYHPLEADTFADWSLEAGDIVTVTRDNKGYASPVHSSVVSWRKQPQVTISSTGNESRESISKISQKKYRGGSGSLRNSQYLHYYVEDQYKQMRSGLELTTSSASLYVQDAYKQLKAGLDLTSSSASLYVEDRYNQMKSGLDLTTSSAHLYVTNAYKQMTAGLKLSSSSAVLYAKSRTSKAEIIARINETGESEALIRADRVSISGRTTINDVMTISEQRLYITKDTRISGNLMLASLQMRGAGDDNTITPAEFASIIKQATVSGNTLTLTKIDGTKVTFRRATQLSGTWSGSGKLTVTADDSSVPSYVRLLVAKPASGGRIPIYAQWGSSGQYEEDTGFSVSVPAAPTDLGIYDSNSQPVSHTTLNYGQSLGLWAGYYDPSSSQWQWGTGVYITAPSDRTKISNSSFTCKITEEAGGTRYKYTLTASISSGTSVPLVDGQTYILYKQ